MPPSLRPLLVVLPFAGDGALSRFGDGAIAVRLHELPRIFGDHGLFHDDLLVDDALSGAAGGRSLPAKDRRPPRETSRR